MLEEEVIGHTILALYETQPDVVQDGIPGPASYFDIVLELDNGVKYELGAHSISKWDRADKLFPAELPCWAVDNKLTVTGQKITAVQRLDEEESYDCTLRLILDDNVYIEHQTSNGDQLYIDYVDEL